MMNALRGRILSSARHVECLSLCGQSRASLTVRQSPRVLSHTRLYASGGTPTANPTSHSADDENGGRAWWRAAPAVLAGSGLLTALWYFWRRDSECTAVCKKPVIPHLSYDPGSVVEGKPTYTASEVKQHNSADAGVWVTYKNGVYDVTKFVRWHPGGDKILLAAGGSLEPFFALYAAHKTTEVMEILESMRIGNIFDTKLPRIHDAFEKDPERSAALKVNSEKPFNAEPPRSLLADSFITPSDLFFVRNHLPVPVVSENMAAGYTLEGKVDKEKRVKSLSMNKLKSLPKHQITCTLQCAGNRRAEMSEVRQVKGLTWDAGSISTATWTGPRLKDVLEAMGFKESELKGKFVQFEGLDKDPEGMPYGSSIAAEVAWDPRRDVIVAYEMNDEPIPADHGFPLRVIIPGVVGARNVKWLKRIVISDEESPSHWQRKDYKTFNPSVDFNSTNFDVAYSIQEMPVQSAICEPSPSTVVTADDGYVTVKGYAYSGGGRGIIRVDLSLDGGETWVSADLDNQDQSMYRSWAWTLWDATLPIPEGHKGELHIVCKAIDSSHNVQPESVNGIWNVRGLLNNSWHKVTVKVK